MTQAVAGLPEHRGEGVGDLAGEVLLEDQPVREAVEQRREPAEADDRCSCGT